MNLLYKILIALVIIFAISTGILSSFVKDLKVEKETYESNSSALLSDIKRMQIDSTTNAVDVKVLKLTLDEFKQHRVKDAEEISKLKVKLKDLQVVAKHNMEVDAKIDAVIRDTLVLRDTLLQKMQSVHMVTPYIQISGIIEDDRLSGNIHLPVNIHQSVWIEYKHRFLWFRWGTKTIHQTIMTDNPHVKINYSEVIQLRK